MVVNVGINGFGRIGRIIFRAISETNELEVSAINDPAIDIDYMCYLMKFDSTHGKFNKQIIFRGNEIFINDGTIVKVFNEKLPSTIPWESADVQYVVEASGMFTSLAKSSGHLESKSVKRVILTAPSVDIPMIILGVNENQIATEHKVISSASSTLYCLAPIIKILEDNYGVAEGFITSIHAMTPSLKPLDGLCLRGKYWRDHRSIHQNIIPAATGACRALGKIMPQLKDKIIGIAFRVPIVNVSVLDITIRLTKETTLEDIVKHVETASQEKMKNIIKVSNEKSVSSDFMSDTNSCILDVNSSLQLTPKFFKLICWYENEYSYAWRVINTIMYSEKCFKSELLFKLQNAYKFTATFYPRPTSDTEKILCYNNRTKNSKKLIASNHCNVTSQSQDGIAKRDSYWQNSDFINIMTNYDQPQNTLRPFEGNNIFLKPKFNADSKVFNFKSTQPSKENTNNKNFEDETKVPLNETPEKPQISNNNNNSKDIIYNDKVKMVQKILKPKILQNRPMSGNSFHCKNNKCIQSHVFESKSMIIENNRHLNNMYEQTKGNLFKANEEKTNNENNINDVNITKCFKINDPDNVHGILKFNGPELYENNEQTSSKQEELNNDKYNNNAYIFNLEFRPNINCNMNHTNNKSFNRHDGTESEEKLSTNCLQNKSDDGQKSKQDIIAIVGNEYNEDYRVIEKIDGIKRAEQYNLNSILLKNNLNDDEPSISPVNTDTTLSLSDKENISNIYDKLDSESASGSDNSFQIHEKKSQIINMTDLTASIEDLARLDKICKIIEISDDLSDRLFSVLDNGKRDSNKKWSFKDLCERLKLDEFYNTVFGQPPIRDVCEEKSQN